MGLVGVLESCICEKQYTTIATKTILMAYKTAVAALLVSSNLWPIGPWRKNDTSIA